MTEDEELERNEPQVRRTVFAGIAHRRVIRQRRMIALIAGAALLLVAGVSVGAAQLVQLQSQPTLDGTVICYRTQSLDEPYWFTVGDDAVIEVHEFCADMWVNGDVGPLATTPEETGLHDAPVIAACLDPRGLGAGFPIWHGEYTEKELCDKLGLPVWDGSLQSTDVPAFGDEG